MLSNIYIHWPWCAAKCPYCDFNSHVTPPEAELWLAACCAEVDHYAPRFARHGIKTIFFGGGTPSLMPPDITERLLAYISGKFSISDDAEITLETNPATSDAARFRAFRAAGINRMSIGVQSLRDEALAFLGRKHSAAEAKAAVMLASKIFDNVSCDLIYAHVGQSVAQWRDELAEALALETPHLSLYQLTIEPGTMFATRAMREELVAPIEKSADLYTLTIDVTLAAGRPAYEISNHAAAGRECRHNLSVWNYADYIGIGPGAHGRYKDSDGRRIATVNHRAPDVWIKAVRENGVGTATEQSIAPDMAMREALLMGMRLIDGISSKRWGELFNKPLSEFLDNKRLQRLIAEGYIIEDQQGIRATSEGRLRLNGIIKYLDGH